MAVPKLHVRGSFLPDDRQREAIEHVSGPMLVVAGAGTGKTSVLTHRIARLVEAGHAHPDQILALTYTRASAGEMGGRVRSLLRGREVHVFTFHDYCNQLLKRAGKDFGVLDEKDIWIFLRKRIRELHLEHFVRAANVGQFLSDLLIFVSRCHDELITPERYAEYVQGLERGQLQAPRVAKSKEELSADEVLGRCREIARVFATTERWLREENLGTFSHMITHALALLESDKELLAGERKRARFILVDEFQDVNFAQIKILSALAGAEGNLFAVGDPDQAIYRFRGASSAAFELFHRHFRADKVVVLRKNRRSTAPILRCAFAVINENPQAGVGKWTNSNGAHKRAPLESAREEQAAGEGKQLPRVPVEVVSFVGRDAEGPEVVRVIRELQRKLRCKWKDFGILYRSHPNRDDVVRELAEAGIPFTIENMDVSDTAEARDLFACVGAVASPGDDASFFRVAALPQFDIDPQQLRAAMRGAARNSRDGEERRPLASVLADVEGGRAVVEAVQHVREEINLTGAKGRKAVDIIATRFGLDTHSVILRAALKFVGDWEAKVLTKTGELSELLEFLRYFREAGGVIPLTSDENENAVRLMTAHLAKGLEFPHVFILRANKNSFPCSYRESLVEFPRELRDRDSIAEGDEKTLHDEEERRLFYVAMTRARDSLRIYAKQGTGKEKSPASLMRPLLLDSSMLPWLTSRLVAGSQTEIDIFAEASPAYAAVSRTAEWLAIPAVEGLQLRLSASAVDTYERCPLQFKLERDWRMSREIPAAMRYGAAMHRVLRTYYDAIRQGRPRTDEELFQLFRDDLASEGIAEPYQHELYEKQGLGQLRDFFAAAQSAAMPEVLHTEEGFEIRIGPAIVSGRIDRIDRSPDGGVAIVDYKTGKARPQEDADKSFQLSVYALAAREKWGYRVNSLAFHNLEENVLVFTTRNEAQLQETRARVEAAAGGIADGQFSPKVDYHCGFCPYRNLCPAKEKRIPNLSSSAARQSN